MKLVIILAFVLTQLLPARALLAQTHRATGLRDNTPHVFAFTNAHIVASPEKVFENATLVIRNGIIEAIGADAAIPPDAWITDLEGKTIYPGFIDAYSFMGIPTAKEIAEKEKQAGKHWNPQVRSHYSSAQAWTYDEEAASTLRSQGFVAAHVISGTGVFSGHGSVVKLAEDLPANQIIKADFTQGLSFRWSRELGRGYPTSVMGSIALMRQGFYDADWYARAHEQWRHASGTMARPEFNPALAAISTAMNHKLPFIIHAPDEEWILRANRLAKEFDLPLWIAGSGHEYKRAGDIQALGFPLIIPVAFPQKPEVAKPEMAINLSLEELRHWALAARNPAILEENGLSFSFTTHGLEKKSDFLKNIRTAVHQGLGPAHALAALTSVPASLLGIDMLYGSLEKGKSACFIVASGDLFVQNNAIEEVWVQGKKHLVSKKAPVAGKWKIPAGVLPESMLELEQSGSRLEGSLLTDADTLKIQDVQWENNRLSFRMEKDSLSEGMRLSASLYGESMNGFGETSSGELFTWHALREATGKTGPSADEKKEDSQAVPDFAPLYPAMEYGISEAVEQPAFVLLRNATIWTQGPDGILENADLLIERGVIQAVGSHLAAPAGATIIDGTGKHATPGLIDPHLHTSIAGGVNETGDAITSETRISDVIEANNVWIYRLLAGGLTTANLFHGSANPIGGQSAVIKLRWGGNAEDLIYEHAAPGLKFALGENVKGPSNRYPDTRMGTEQILRDAFLAALQYEKDKQAARGSGRRQRDAFRKDLQLEAVLEVIKGERLAHVHAYRADEMLMMMRLAEAFGFRVASFEHTVEGYKIADELREHGAAAIVWTDWSSFKMEAYNAIYQNARLLLDAGVLTSLHSDNTALATRMNWEAGKIRTSGVDEVSALNLVTLYPARILQIDHRTGTLEAGKDADFVVWNGHPLSAYSTAEQTWVEGRKFFDRQNDRLLQQEIIRQRAEIIRMKPGETRQ